MSKPEDFRVAFSKKHICELDINEEETIIPRPAPFAPCYKQILHSFKLWCILDKNHPDTQRFFRSDSAVKREMRRHVLNRKYRCVIHPFSRLSFLRQLIVFVIWVIIFITEPLFKSFGGDYLKPEISGTPVVVNRSEKILGCALNIYLLFDSCMNFFLGYAIEDTKEVVLDQSRIVKHYLKTFFVCDFIGCLENIVLFFIKNQKLCRQLSAGHLYCFRYVRLYTMLAYFYRRLVFYNFKDSTAKCCVLFVLSVFLLHWISCLFYVIPLTTYELFDNKLVHSWVKNITVTTPLRSITSRYLETMMVVFCHFVGAGKGTIITREPAEHIALAFITIAGLLCHSLAIAVMIHIFGAFKVSENKYEEVLHQLNDYVVTKKLPTEIRRRLFLYYEVRFQKHFFAEDIIMRSLSEHLRCEVILHSCKHLIEKVRIFQDVSRSAIGTILTLTQNEIFLNGDILIKPDTINELVYFISSGTVTVLLPNMKEVFHLEDGHHFGEVHIVLQRSNAKSFIAVQVIEPTEVYYLTKDAFLYVLEMFPEMGDRLRSGAATKLQLLKDMIEGGYEEEAVDTVSELRRGKVLEHGIRRN